MKHSTKHRITFGSKLGMIVAAAGSAVGLGNIWRFPSETANGGGAVFILISILCIVIFGIPLLMGEMIVGRAARTNALEAYGKLTGNSRWNIMGTIGLLGAFGILCFYVVVCGWTVYYVQGSLSGALMEVTNYTEHFAAFSSNGLLQALYTVGFTILTAFFIVAGVKRGIELSSKIMMPLLFLLLIGLAVRSMTLEGAWEGIVFLFKPDFSKVSGKVVLSALGQSFFSLSLGMAIMVTYASYFPQTADIRKSAVQVATLDTLVAIMAGMVLFPVAFALSPDPESVKGALANGGPALLFITIPELFKGMLGASIWSTMFFVLLAIAALTSAISLMEAIVVFVHEKFKLSRLVSTIIIMVLISIIGVICGYYPGVFDSLDYTTAKFLLPIGGILVSLFVGWKMDANQIRAELTNNGSLKISAFLFNSYVILLRFVAPALLLMVLLAGLFF